MRVRKISTVGLGVAALVLTTVSMGSAVSASPSAPAALSLSSHSSASGAITSIDKKKGKCKTKLGTPIAPSGDGVISVSGSGLDVAGAADFTCGKRKKGRTISTVNVMGYFGDAGSTQFNVTVYKDKGGEPDNGSKATCATQTVTGTPTGSAYPTADATVIKLAKQCVAKKGTNWLEVQAVSASSWYWETQQEVGGTNPADWRDANGSFGSGCTPGYQDGLYMQDCIFGGDIGENDFMFTLK